SPASERRSARPVMAPDPAPSAREPGPRPRRSATAAMLVHLAMAAMWERSAPAMPRSPMEGIPAPSGHAGGLETSVTEALSGHAGDLRISATEVHLARAAAPSGRGNLGGGRGWPVSAIGCAAATVRHSAPA